MTTIAMMFLIISFFCLRFLMTSMTSIARVILIVRFYSLIVSSISSITVSVVIVRGAAAAPAQQ